MGIARGSKQSLDSDAYIKIYYAGLSAVRTDVVIHSLSPAVRLVKKYCVRIVRVCAWRLEKARQAESASLSPALFLSRPYLSSILASLTHCTAHLNLHARVHLFDCLVPLGVSFDERKSQFCAIVQAEAPKDAKTTRSRPCVHASRGRRGGHRPRANIGDR